VSAGELRQRLAAILAADVAGYSRLMAADERATVAALDAARAVFRAQIESNRGRVIDMAGDSVLAVFEAATGAVSAALAVQRQLERASVEVPDDRRMRFRIGVHLGDVIEKPDGTVYGDGVNIAARLVMLSWIESSVGNGARAKELADQAIRKSPKDRWIGTGHLAHAMSAFIERDYARLRHWAELAVQSHPTAPVRRVLMIAYAAEIGDTELLRAHLEALQRVAPDFIPSLFRGDYRPFRKPEHMTMLLDSLRKAGFAP
jgi:hypothetical protein